MNLNLYKIKLLYNMDNSCPICDDNMEITNKVFLKSDEDNIISNIEETDEDSEIATLQEEDIEHILENNMHNVKLTSKNFNIKDIYKNPYFKKLDDNKKTLVINRIDDKISKIKTKSKSTSKANTQQKPNEQVFKKNSHFYCKTCGRSSIIPKKTLIFSRGYKGNFSKKNEVNLQSVSVYPSTKNYKCINKDCKTHKEPSIKNAVFMRIPGEYIIKYTCNICDFTWDTFITN